MSTEALVLGPHYEQQLVEAGFDQDHIRQAKETRTVDLPYGEGLQLQYSRINEDNGALTFYANGFLEGRIAKTPAALALAETNASGPGLDVVYTDNQRKGTIDPSGKETPRDALRAQALGLLSVMRAETRDGQPVNVLGHSMGSLVVQEAVRIAKEEGSDLFNQANIVLLAPAGLYKQENMPRLMGRFARLVLGSELVSKKDFKDPKGVMIKAGIRNAFANVRKYWAEARAVGRERIDIKEMLAAGIGSLAVVTYGKDTLYGDKHHESVTEAFDDARVSWLTPISADSPEIEKRKSKTQKILDRMDASGRQYSDEQKQLVRRMLMKKATVRGATHNDEQFNPRRVADAIKQHLNILSNR